MLIKAIDGYQGYFISDTGRVFSTRREFKEVKPQYSNAYPHFTAWVDKKAYTLKIHRYTAKAFLGERPEGLCVAHLDGHPNNNNISNLVYTTAKENNGHKRLHGTALIGSTVTGAKLKEQDVPVIRQMIRQGVSRKEIGAKFGVHESTVKDIYKNVTWTHVPVAADAIRAIPLEDK